MHAINGREYKPKNIHYTYRPKVKSKLKTKTQAVLFNSLDFNSGDVFQHCVRIPDVMVCVNKARAVLKARGVDIPLWMWGLVEKDDLYDEISNRLMSFLLSVGLYERLTRSLARPDFLIGASPALCVCAKIKTFERSLLNVIRGKKSDRHIVKMYKRNAPQSAYFSLQYYSVYDEDYLQNLHKKYLITHCTSILPVSDQIKKNLSSHGVTVESVIEQDAHLSWLWMWLVLRNNRIKKTKQPYVPLC